MKPPPETRIPRHPDSPRRKRTLSEEERTLWESVTRQAKPLRMKRLAATPPAAVEVEMRRPTKAVPQPKLAPVATSSPPVKPAVPPLAPLGRRERLQLSRGRKEIEARLDLHGMTQVRAHRALSAFLHRVHSEGLTFVLIITGKGKTGTESERGVLRRQVPQWLSQPEFRGLIVGFEEAHVGHGGAGALYVRIRRSRI
jgi:DNA-nicking Smr family endonuclease